MAKKAVPLTLMAALVAFILLFDWNWLRGPLSRYISAKLERPFSINGNLSVNLAMAPLIQADKLVLGNASWSDEPIMARAERVAVRVNLRELLAGRVLLPEVTLVEPRLLLERNAEADANWRFARTAEDEGTSPVVDRLTITDGVVRYRDSTVATDVTLNIASQPSRPDSEERTVRFAGSGTLRQQPFKIAGVGDSLLALKHAGTPYRLNVRAQAGDTRAAFAGTLIPFDFRTIDGRLELEGTDLSKLYPIIPVPLPWTPPYQISGHLVRQEKLWSFRQFDGKVGKSDLAGEFSVDLSRQKPKIGADLISRSLNYKDLGGFIGAPPGGNSGQSATPEQKKERRKRAASGRVLPDKPFSFQRLHAADADVRFRGERIQTSKLPLDKLRARLRLNSGVLRLEPLDFGVAGGHVVAHISMDARASPIRTRAEITARNVELKRIYPELKPPKGDVGKVGGRADLKATGNSVASMFKSLDGELGLIMRGGQASTLTLVLSNLDLARAVQLLMKGDENSNVRCGTALFAADKGILNTQLLVVDTDVVKIRGDGQIDFHRERYDLRLSAQSKRPSPLALRGPIVIGGSFNAPDVKPAVGPLLARAGAALGLGVLVGPLAALAPLVDVGGAENADCDALIRTVQQETGSKAPARRQRDRSK